MTTKRKPTTATLPTAWGEPKAELHELPSGKAMVLRHGPCMSKLIREGVIPNPLMGGVVEVDEDGGMKPGVDWKAREEHRSAVVCAMAVDPAVTLEPLEGAVVYDLLDERDVEFIVTLAQEGVSGLARFRTE